MSKNQVNSETVPFLTKYAHERTVAPDISGEYNQDLSMWSIQAGGGVSAFIDENQFIAELTTKTMVQREMDDQKSNMIEAELATKTDTQTEQDDVSVDFAIELATKTEAQLEHEDISPQSGWLFI